MKKIQEMTHAEIIKLTQDDINRMTEIACAERGIKPVERPVKPEAPPERQTCPGYHIGGVVVYRLEAAEAIESCLKQYEDDIAAIEDYHWNEIEPKSFKLQIQHTNIKLPEPKSMQERRVAYSRELKIYDALLAEYEGYSKHYREVMEEVSEVWCTHLEKERKILSLKRQLKRYLDLAEGNVLVSMRFFSAAFTDDYQEVKELFDPEEYLEELKAQGAEAVGTDPSITTTDAKDVPITLTGSCEDYQPNAADEGDK